MGKLLWGCLVERMGWGSGGVYLQIRSEVEMKCTVEDGVVTLRSLAWQWDSD